MALEAAFGSQIFEAASAEMADAILKDDSVPCDLVISEHGGLGTLMVSLLATRPESMKGLILWKESATKPIPVSKEAKNVETFDASQPIDSLLPVILRMTSSSAPEKASDQERFCRISAPLLVAASPLGGDVYIALSAAKYLRIFRQGDSFTGEDLQKYHTTKGVEYFYLKAKDSVGFLEKVHKALVRITEMSEIAAGAVEVEEEARTAEPQITEPKAAEPKAAEPKAAEPKAAEPKAAEPKAAEPKAAEPKAAEPKAAEPKAAEPKAAEPKAAEPKAAEPKAAEPGKPATQAEENAKLEAEKAAANAAKLAAAKAAAAAAKQAAEKAEAEKAAAAAAKVATTKAATKVEVAAKEAAPAAAVAAATDSTKLVEALKKDPALIHSTLHELTKGMGFTPEVQAVVKECARVALASLKKSPKLSQLLKSIERDSEHYVASHSQIVAHLACAIASQMDWRSDSTFQKLTIAAMMHDMPFRNQKLAAVQNLEALKARESEFTPEEVQSYRTHPQVAAQLVRAFTEIPADVDVIVEEHHERPDGTGFPRGMSHSRIGPLSAVFILAHDLAKFILDRDPGGNKTLEMGPKQIAEFYQIHKDAYKAGTFRKVLKVVEKMSL